MPSSPLVCLRSESALSRREPHLWVRLIVILLAHAGWRPESRNVPWLLAVVASCVVAALIAERADPAITLIYFGLAWAFFYVGHTLVVARRVRLPPRAPDEELRAWHRYQPVLGLMFANQGLALGAVCALAAPPWELPLSELGRLAIGLPMFATGFIVKVWATAVVGVDTYFFRDLFTRRPFGAFVVRGPYRLFDNPMYGPGYLHAYALAILAGSWIGLAAAALCQLGMYGFYLLVERPFVRAAYTAPETNPLVATPQEVP